MLLWDAYEPPALVGPGKGPERRTAPNFRNALLIVVGGRQNIREVDNSFTNQSRPCRLAEVEKLGF